MTSESFANQNNALRARSPATARLPQKMLEFLMPSPVETYVAEVAGKYATGRAGEHAYRPAFEKLIQALDPKLKIVNDPKRTEHGAPDFVFVRGDLTAGYAETKDVGVSLDKTEKSEQMERYLGYSKLILTDYLEFRFFHNGQKYEEPIVIGTLKSGRIIGTPDQYEKLADTLKDFLNEAPEQIRNGARLAEIMGGKARRIRDNVRQYLAQRIPNETVSLSEYSKRSRDF